MLGSLRTTAVTVASAAVATSLLLATPAQARPYGHHDAVGDARSINLSSEESRPAPDEVGADATNVTVRHGRHRLTMRIETVDLTRDDSAYGALFRIKTPTARYQGIVFATKSGRDSYVRLTAVAGRSRSEPCRRVFADIDFRADAYLLSVPRSCLDNPRTVQVGAAVIKGRSSMVVADDAQRDGGDLKGLTLSPRLVSGRPR